MVVHGSGSSTVEPSGVDEERLLSEVQARILEGVAAGHSSADLARELFFSPKSIDYHVRSMSDKVAAPNRVALVSRAFFLGILRTDSWPPKVVDESVKMW